MVDLFQGGEEVSWEKPEWVANMYPSQRWRKYMMNLWSKKLKKHRPNYARYLCAKWNQEHPEAQQLAELSIYFMLEKTRPYPEQPKVKKRRLLKHSCSEQHANGKAKPKIKVKTSGKAI